MTLCQPGLLDEFWASEVTKQNIKVHRARGTVAEFVFWLPHVCAHTCTHKYAQSGEVRRMCSEQATQNAAVGSD